MREQEIGILTDAGVALDVHVVPEGQHHLLDLDRQLPCGGISSYLKIN